MKKNLLLVSILSALILFAYLWEQKGIKKDVLTKEKVQKIFDVDTKSLVELTIKNTKVINTNGAWIIGELNYPADINKINFIIKTLSGISSISRIDDKSDTEQFFVHQDHSFRVKNFEGEIGFRLGDISPVTGYFYIEKFENGKKELFLAKDTNAYDGIYKDDLEAEFRKYLAFKNIITMKPMQLISQNLIPSLKIVDVTKVEIDNKANRWFQVDFLQEKTKPSILKSLKYKNLYKVIGQLWNKVKVTKIVALGKNIVSEQMSKIIFTTKNTNFVITLFGKFNGATGYFAVLDGEDKVFVIDEGSKDFFFANVQKFWHKAIDYQTDFSKIKKFVFKLGDRKNKYQFKVEDIEKFEAKTDDPLLESVKSYNVNMLFNLVLNLVEFKEAKYVTGELTKIQKSDIVLTMTLFNKDLNIVFKANSITVQDLSANLEYFYPHKIASINVKGASDFFTLK